MKKFIAPIVVLVSFLLCGGPLHSSGEALRCARVQDRAERAACLDRLINSGTDLANSYFQRGIVHAQSGNHDRAIADYNNAIKLGSSTWAAPHAWRALTLWGQGLHNQALADLNIAIGRKGDWDRLYGFRGELYLAMKDYNKSIADLGKAIQVYSGEGEADVNRWRSKLEEAKDGLKNQVAVTTPPLDKSVTLQKSKEQQGPAMKLSPPGRRVALVIGNSDYGAFERLVNPANGARAVAASLRRLGFADVVERYNLSLTGMIETLKAFGDKPIGADWSIIFWVFWKVVWVDLKG